jgi:hypothetical protein
MSDNARAGWITALIVLVGAAILSAITDSAPAAPAPSRPAPTSTSWPTPTPTVTVTIQAPAPVPSTPPAEPAPPAEGGNTVIVVPKPHIPHPHVRNPLNPCNHTRWC